MEKNLKFVNDYDEKLFFEYTPEIYTFVVKGYCSQTFFMDGDVRKQVEKYLNDHISSIPTNTQIRICFHTEYLDSKVFRFFKDYFSRIKASKPISFRLEIGSNHRVYGNLYNNALPGFEVKVANGN